VLLNLAAASIRSVQRFLLLCFPNLSSIVITVMTLWFV
jgi:hypothetical protein